MWVRIGVGVGVSVWLGIRVWVGVFDGLCGKSVFVGAGGGGGGGGRVEVEIGASVFVMEGNGVEDGWRVLVGGGWIMVTLLVGVRVLIVEESGVFVAICVEGMGVPVTWAIAVSAGSGGTQKSPKTTASSVPISLMNASTLIGGILSYGQG